MHSMIVGICGAGTMGRGIAIAALSAGHRVILYDAFAEQREKANEIITDTFSRMVEKGRITDADRITALSRLSSSAHLKDLEECQIVIEAILEQLQMKQELFVELEEIVSDSAILATNTSSISIAAIGRPLKNASRFVGLHFFNPAHLMKLVEVIRGPLTTDITVTESTSFIRQLGKTPVVAKDVPGFIVNRIARNFYNEAQRIVMEGAASITQVDELVKGLGFRMGPFELMDLIGVDTNLDVTKSQWQQFFFEPRFQPSLLQQHYVDSGLLGKKTDGGFY